MSEDIKNKAVELSDGEMDAVSGGKAMIVEDSGNSRSIYTCNGGETCDKLWSVLQGNSTCSKCRRKNNSLPKICSNCWHYATNSFSSANLSPAEYLRPNGYDFRHITL